MICHVTYDNNRVATTHRHPVPYYEYMHVEWVREVISISHTTTMIITGGHIFNDSRLLSQGDINRQYQYMVEVGKEV